MSKVEQVRIDGMTVDKRTGAVLSPHPEGRLRERELSVEPTRGSNAVEVRASRARGMKAQGRWIRVWGEPKDFRFHTQTTVQFEDHEVPNDDEGYHGRVRLDEFERIVGGRCSCPDWKKGRAKLPNGVTFCKHMEFARLRALKDGLDKRHPITLELGWDGKETLERVKVNGRFREPKSDLKTAREWLVKHGYDRVAIEPMPNGLIRQTYA